jgi:hypothetical protein
MTAGVPATVTASVLESPVDFALREVDLVTALVFGVSEREDLRLLRALREATSHAVRLRWRLAGRPTLPLDTHAHLLPPLDGVDGPSREHARSWAARYRYGAFHYRHGPGFVAVRDARPGRDHCRLVITEGSAELLEMVAADTIEKLTPAAREAVPEAVAAGLAVVADGALLVLPYRMRHWPVPIDGL